MSFRMPISLQVLRGSRETQLALLLSRRVTRLPCTVASLCGCCDLIVLRGAGMHLVAQTWSFLGFKGCGQSALDQRSGLRGHQAPLQV